MRWRVVDKYHMVSECGYTISKSWVADDVRYASWSPPDTPVPGYSYLKSRLLGISDTRRAAIEMCIADLGEGTPPSFS
jgi:hypothetical protein